MHIHDRIAEYQHWDPQKWSNKQDGNIHLEIQFSIVICCCIIYTSKLCSTFYDRIDQVCLIIVWDLQHPTMPSATHIERWFFSRSHSNQAAYLSFYMEKLPKQEECLRKSLQHDAKKVPTFWRICAKRSSPRPVSIFLFLSGTSSPLSVRLYCINTRL